MRILERHINQLMLLSDPDVHLPAVFSEKGFSRTNYTPADAVKYVQAQWPSTSDVYAECLASIERVRPIFVATGCAEVSTLHVRVPARCTLRVCACAKRVRVQVCVRVCVRMRAWACVGVLLFVWERVCCSAGAAACRSLAQAKP